MEENLPIVLPSTAILSGVSVFAFDAVLGAISLHPCIRHGHLLEEVHACSQRQSQGVSTRPPAVHC